MADFRWYGAQCQKAIEAELGRRLDACAIAVSNRAKKLLSVEGAGADVGGGLIVQSRGNRKAKGRLVYGAFPSRPLEPPHKQTGRLQSSVAWERNGLVARVGTNVKYGRFLELSTSKMAPRPWLKRALTECIPAINIVMSRPFPGK